MLAILGATSVACGIGFIIWLISGGGLTIPEVAFMLAISGPLLAFGGHCLDTVFLARTNSHSSGKTPLLI